MRARTAVLVATVITLLTCAACSGSSAASRPTPSATTTAASSVPPGPATPTGHQQFHRITSDTGRLLQTQLVGTRSGVTMQVWVWLPPQYDQPAYAHTAFPALMLYPGGTGAERNAWVGTALGGREDVAAGARDGSVTPFIFVMPSMQVSAQLDTECADLPGQPKVGTFLAVDVRQMVEENFRTIRDRSGWGAAGTSSGAYCAARLVFGHPDQYRAVVSIGGYFTIETNLPGNDDATVRAGDPAAIARRSPPDVSVLLWAGGANDVKVAKRFMALVRPPTTAELRVQQGGAHLTVDFAKMVPDALTFLTGKLSRPKPLG